jgi:cytochrome P450
MLCDQVAVQYVMLTASKRYVKVKQGLALIRRFFGEGLLGVDGEVHKKHRKVAYPAFTSKAVDELTPIM